jgi:hypothetical protein
MSSGHKVWQVHHRLDKVSGIQVVASCWAYLFSKLFRLKVKPKAKEIAGVYFKWAIVCFILALFKLNQS